MGNKAIGDTKEMLLKEIDRRVEDKVLESANATLLKKLIRNADNDNEALAIASLGTTYKKQVSILMCVMKNKVMT